MWEARVEVFISHKSQKRCCPNKKNKTLISTRDSTTYTAAGTNGLEND